MSFHAFEELGRILVLGCGPFRAHGAQVGSELRLLRRKQSGERVERLGPNDEIERLGVRSGLLNEALGLDEPARPLGVDGKQIHRADSVPHSNEVTTVESGRIGDTHHPVIVELKLQPPRLEPLRHYAP